MRIAIVTDSNSGITQEQGREAGNLCGSDAVYDGWTGIFEDISLTQKNFTRSWRKARTSPHPSRLPSR